MTDAARHTLRTDGGSRGNPGPAGIGFVLDAPDGTILDEGGRFLGTATNNVAEYEALLWGLDRAAAAGIRALDIRLDSELIVRQILGEYRVKDRKLQPLYAQVTDALASFDDVHVAHIPREQNADADAHVNAALDAELSVTREAAAESEMRAEAGADLPSPPPGGGVWELSVRGHFDAAHELVGYPGECRDLHGHTWDVEVFVAGTQLDAVGIVYDFKRLKDDLAAVLDPYDHAHLNEVPPFDELNPTAENLARVIFEALAQRVGAEVTVREVAVWESPIARIAYRPVGRSGS